MLPSMKKAHEIASTMATPSSDLILAVDQFRRTLAQIDAWCSTKAPLIWTEADDESGLTFRVQAAQDAREAAAKRLLMTEAGECSAGHHHTEAEAIYKHAVRAIKLLEYGRALVIAKGLAEAVETDTYFTGSAFAWDKILPQDPEQIARVGDLL